jgi:hypothetical protein
VAGWGKEGNAKWAGRERVFESFVFLRHSSFTAEEYQSKLLVRYFYLPFFLAEPRQLFVAAVLNCRRRRSEKENFILENLTPVEVAPRQEKPGAAANLDNRAKIAARRRVRIPSGLNSHLFTPTRGKGCGVGEGRSLPTPPPARGWCGEGEGTLRES